MKLHNLKIHSVYAIEKIKGNKLFEIRFNDRDYHVGDEIIYSCPDSKSIDYIISKRRYYISYITDYNQREGYVVFAEKEL